jgi:hypothetical protein
LNAEILMRLENSLADGSIPQDLPSAHLKGVQEKIDELDAVLKEHEARFKAASEYIKKVEEYMDGGDGRPKPVRPNEGLDWVDFDRDRYVKG